MKKIYLLLTIALLAAVMVGCKGDDNTNTPDPTPGPTNPIENYKGRYFGSYSVESTAEAVTFSETEQQAVEVKVASDKKSLIVSIKDFYLPINNNLVRVGKIDIPSLKVKLDGTDKNKIEFEDVDISEALMAPYNTTSIKVGATLMAKSLTLVFKLSSVSDFKYDVVYSGTKTDMVSLNTQSSLLGFELKTEGVGPAAIIDEEQKRVLFTASEGADLSKVFVKMTVSDGATIEPGSRTAIDFTNATSADNAVDIVVTPENRAATGTTIYKAYHVSKEVAWSFDKWREQSAQGLSAQMELVEGDWVTGNRITNDLNRYMNPAVAWPVTPADDQKSVSLKTTKVNLANATLQPIKESLPEIVTGTMYTGWYKFSSTEAMTSTKFGTPALAAPSKISGKYKYIPGEDYYVKVDGKHEWVIDNTKKDTASLMVVLYEVANYSESLDGTNVSESNKIVMLGMHDLLVTEGEEYQDFSFDLELLPGKTYDANKKYKYVVVFNSSKAGQEGAPGSNLMLDSATLTFK